MHAEYASGISRVTYLVRADLVVHAADMSPHAGCLAKALGAARALKVAALLVNDTHVAVTVTLRLEAGGTEWATMHGSDIRSLGLLLHHRCLHRP